MRATLVLLAFGLLAVNAAYGFNCYVCNNCPELLKDQKTQKCEEAGDTYEPTLPDDWVPPTTKPPNGGSTESSSVQTTESSSVQTTASSSVQTTQSTEAAESTTLSTTKTEHNSGSERKFFNKYAREDESKEEYQCFKQTVKYGDGEYIRKGCMKAITTECTKEGHVKDCSVCKDDSCNPATNVKSWALSSLMLVAIFKMFF